MSEGPLTDAELAKIREFLPHLDAVKDEFKYKAARKLIMKTWRAGIIFIAGILAAALALQETLRSLLRAWLQ